MGAQYPRVPVTWGRLIEAETYGQSRWSEGELQQGGTACAEAKRQERAGPFGSHEMRWSETQPSRNIGAVWAAWGREFGVPSEQEGCGQMGAFSRNPLQLLSLEWEMVMASLRVQCVALG